MVKISKASDDMEDQGQTHCPLHQGWDWCEQRRFVTNFTFDKKCGFKEWHTDTDCINALLLPPNGTCSHIEAGIASRPPLHQGRHHFEATTALRRQTTSLHWGCCSRRRSGSRCWQTWGFSRCIPNPYRRQGPLGMIWWHLDWWRSCATQYDCSMKRRLRKINYLP